MKREEFVMDTRDLGRLEVIREVARRRLRQREAAVRLGLGERQVRRLVRRYREAGPAGLVRRYRGRSPGNAKSRQVRTQALAWVRKRYTDFGPTLACEKLAEEQDLCISRETLRQWMISAGLWRAKSRSRARLHPRRPRRLRLGELVQVDGSRHAWFEGRAEPCTLLVFIDDATGRLLALRFVQAETTAAYLQVLREYLHEYGRPVAVYTDQHSVFRVNHPGREGNRTQFTRVLESLDIQPIHASTPQAKGRVERAHQTLQDRLVKELRLRGIRNLEQANALLPEFRKAYNQSFAVAAQCPEDAHRQVEQEAAELDWIFSHQESRKLSRQLSFQYRNREYQVQGQGRGYRLRGQFVTVCESFADGAVRVLYEERPLRVSVLAESRPAVPLNDAKSVLDTVSRAQREQRLRAPHRPPADHPWRRYTSSTGSSP